jgi:ferredoxin
MKIHIDRDNCTSCGTCWETCPAFFEENSDDAFSQIREESRISEDIARGLVPVDLEDCVRDAADLCPVSVIHVED